MEVERNEDGSWQHIFLCGALELFLTLASGNRNDTRCRVNRFDCAIKGPKAPAQDVTRLRYPYCEAKSTILLPSQASMSSGKGSDNDVLLELDRFVELREVLLGVLITYGG